MTTQPHNGLNSKAILIKKKRKLSYHVFKSNVLKSEGNVFQIEHQLLQ